MDLYLKDLNHWTKNTEAKLGVASNESLKAFYTAALKDMKSAVRTVNDARQSRQQLAADLVYFPAAKGLELIKSAGDKFGQSAFGHYYNYQFLKSDANKKNILKTRAVAPGTDANGGSTRDANDKWVPEIDDQYLQAVGFNSYLKFLMSGRR